MGPVINQSEINSIDHVIERRKQFQRFKLPRVEDKVVEVTDITDKKEKDNADSTRR